MYDIPKDWGVGDQYRQLRINVVGITDAGGSAVTVSLNGSTANVSELTWRLEENRTALVGSASLVLAVGSNTVTVQYCNWSQPCLTQTTTVTRAAPPPPMAARGAPIVEYLPGARYRRAVAGCPACADATLSYSTPAYRSRDQDRSLTLVYSSATSAPRGQVSVIASANSADTVRTMSLSVLQDGVAVPLTTGGTEVFYRTPYGTGRLTAQFDASGMFTRYYDMTAVVRNHWSDGAFTETRMPFQAVVVNNRAATQGTSGFGNGWSVAGLQVLRTPNGPYGTLMIEEDGRTTLFTSCGYFCWTGPAGDGTTVTQGPNSTFVRRYRDGTVAMFEPQYGLMISLASRLGEVTQFGYHADGRLSSVTDPAGFVTKVDWSAPRGLAGYATITTLSGTTGARTSTIYIDNAGQLIRIVDPDNVQALALSYLNDRLAEATDRSGSTTGFGYDVHGGLTTVTAPTFLSEDLGPTRPVTTIRSELMSLLPTPGTGGSLGAAATLTYQRGTVIRGPRGDDSFVVANPAGNVTSVSLNTPAGTHEEITLQIDDETQHLLRSADSRGANVAYTWTGNDVTFIQDHTRRVFTEVTYTLLGQPETVIVNQVQQERNYYSSDGRAVLDSTRSGPSTAHFTYDAVGRVRTVLDGAGHASSFEYGGAHDNLLSATSNGKTTTFGYDEAGRPTRVTNPLSQTVNTTLDALNRVRTMSSPSQGTSTWTYDDLARTSHFDDARGERHTSVMNPLGALIQSTSPAGGTATFRYDRNGDPSTSTNRRGQQRVVSFDAAGRTKSYGAAGMTTTVAYDTLSTWVAYSNAESTDSIFSDAAGRVTRQVSVREGQTFTTVTGWGDMGEKASRGTTGPGWSQGVLFGLDEIGRPTLVWDAGFRHTNLTFNADNQPETVRLPTGYSGAQNLWTTYTYEPNHRLNSVRANFEGEDLNWGYSYDELDRTNAQSRGYALQRTRFHEYDPAGRLSHWSDYKDFPTPVWICETSEEGDCYWDPQVESRLMREATLSWDVVGNPVGAGIAVQPGNRLTSYGGYTMSYDEDGNMLTKSGNGLYQTFAWDAFGTLVSVSTNGAVTTFGYDGLGRRVRKTHNGVTTRYLYDGQDMILQLDGAGQRQLEFSYYSGVDQPHAVKVSATGAVYYYSTSQPGNVTALVNAQNTVVNRYEYTPFGESLAKTEQVVQPFQFAARQFDPETGLYYNRARYYDPSLGRFISEDPIGLAGGVNQYAYAGNDPVNATDPSGLCTAAEADHIYYTKDPETGDWTELRRCPGGYDHTVTWGRNFPLAGIFSLQRAMARVGDVTGISGMGEGADRMMHGDVAGGGAQMAMSIPVFPVGRSARFTTDVGEVFFRLKKYNGIERWLASQRLHAIKEAASRGPADNVLFDLSGGVWDPKTFEWLGSLTEGGAKKLWRP